MTAAVTTTLRILSRFWLEEIRPDDADIIAALPELAQTLPNFDTATLTELAVEYQRLFGFNLPPYESVFIDPSAMLMAPATQRVQMLYRQGGWSLPAEVRTGAPDHLGLELLALTWGLETGQIDPPALTAENTSPSEVMAYRLHTQHLALWVPVFRLALGRLAPHPFYAMLGDLTLDLILSTIPTPPLPASNDPFPELPQSPSPFVAQFPVEDEDDEISLRDIINQLLPPCKAGLFLTREDIARIGQTLNSPGVMGERYRMLETLFRFAGQYELISKLFSLLTQNLVEAGVTYQKWATEYPAWTLYAEAWQHRLASTQAMLEELRQLSEETAS